jgi:hypothetical protein
MRRRSAIVLILLVFHWIVKTFVTQSRVTVSMPSMGFPSLLPLVAAAGTARVSPLAGLERIAGIGARTLFRFTVGDQAGVPNASSSTCFHRLADTSVFIQIAQPSWNKPIFTLLC